MKLESERSRFLQEECYVLFRVTASREEARALKKELEASGRFRFVGRVEGGQGMNPNATTLSE